MTTPREILNSQTYKDRLNDPRWHEFSRSIKETKGYFCACCKQAGGAKTEKTLNVHHWFYDSKREPWDYESHEVTVLCGDCHHDLHKFLNEFRRFVFMYFTPQSFRVINGALLVAMRNYDPLEFAYSLAAFVSNPGAVKRFSKSWESR